MGQQNRDLFFEKLRHYLYSGGFPETTTDPGLIKAYTFSLNDNYGHLFENLVFLILKQLGNKIYYYLTKERYEVDFLVERLDGTRKLYQVVWDVLDSKTLAREERAFSVAKQELNLEGELITPDIYAEKAWGSFQLNFQKLNRGGSCSWFNFRFCKII